MTNEAVARPELSFDEPSGQGFDTPLIDFIATGAGWEMKGGMTQKNKPWYRVYFYFINMDVRDTQEPYPYPVGEVSLFYSDPAKSPKRQPGKGINEWTAFSDSLKQFYPDQPIAGLNELFGSEVQTQGDSHTAPTKAGKTLRFTRVPTLLNVPPDESNAKYHDALAPAWKITEVEGKTASSDGSTPSQSGANELLDHVLGMADGKTDDQFYQQALDDDRVMGNPTLVTQLTERLFLNSMKDLGKLSLDENQVWHKV